MASKSKLLVRSHAIQESASPPPSPFKQELKEEEEGEEEETVSVPQQQQQQKNNHDLHLSAPTTTTTAKKEEETAEKLEVKKNSGAIQKNVNINIKDAEKVEKPKTIKTMGSSSSMEGASSGFISRGDDILFL